MINFLFLLISYYSSVNAQTLQIVTSDFAPYQIMTGNKVEGINTETVREVLERAKIKGEIKMYPWPRAYKLAQKEANLIIYSMARTTEREKMFKWIGPLSPYQVYFWRMEERVGIKVKNLEDAKRYVSGGVFDDVKAEYLEKVGFRRGGNLEYVGNDTLNIRKLFAGRIDLLPYDELSLPYKVQGAGYDFKKLVRLSRIEGISHELYMAASLQTPDATVKKLSIALEEFKKTKKFKEIKSRMK